VYKFLCSYSYDFGDTSRGCKAFQTIMWNASGTPIMFISGHFIIMLQNIRHGAEEAATLF